MPRKELTPVTQKITGKKAVEREITEEDRKRSAIDEKLLANAKKSLTELSQMTGLEPKDVAERLAWLLEDRGWMTERMEERYMLIELGDLMSEAKNRLKRAQDKDYGAIGKVVLGAFEQMAQRWDARRAIVDADIDKITQRQAKLYGRTYDVALNHIFESLRAIHPEITDEEEYELKIAGLRAASDALGENVIE